MPRAEDGGELGSPLLSPTEVMERVLSESIPGQDSHADRLFMLKEFRDSGLIDEAVYREMVKVVRHHLDRPDAAQPAIKSGVHESGERPPLTRDMKYKFGLIFAMNVFMVYSQQVTGPVMVFVYTQFFNEAPHHGHCDTKVQMATTGCVDALATMAKVQAWQNMIQGFLTFIVTPVWGKVSDSFGRRYLLIAALFICLLQLGSLILSQPPFNMSLWIYIGLNTCPGGLYSSVANAFIADIFPAEWRAVAFGLLSATWGVGLATGPLVNLIPFKGYTIPMVVSFASSSCCFLYTCCMIPESLEPKNRVTFECGESLNFVKQASVLWYGPKGLSSKILFRRLAICVCVNAMLLDGIGNVWNLFVRREFEFSRQQNVISTVTFGVSRVFVLSVLLRPMLDRFGEGGTLIIGLISNLVFTTYYGFLVLPLAAKTGSVIPVYVGSVIYAFGSVVYPAVATIKSSKCPPDEQGRVLGALNGIQMLAWGLGPMLFNNLFAWLIDSEAQAHFHKRFGFNFPVASVWWVGIFFSVITLALACSIPDPRDVYIEYDKEDLSGVPKTVGQALGGPVTDDKGGLLKPSSRDYTKHMAESRAELRQRLLAAERSRADGTGDYRSGYR